MLREYRSLPSVFLCAHVNHCSRVSSIPNRMLPNYVSRDLCDSRLSRYCVKMKFFFSFERARFRSRRNARRPNGMPQRRNNFYDKSVMEPPTTTTTTTTLVTNPANRTCQRRISARTRKKRYSYSLSQKRERRRAGGERERGEKGKKDMERGMRRY